MSPQYSQLKKSDASFVGIVSDILIALLATGHQRQPALFHRETFYFQFYKF